MLGWLGDVSDMIVIGIFAEFLTGKKTFEECNNNCCWKIGSRGDGEGTGICTGGIDEGIQWTKGDLR
jgi:hypothetical protein